MDGDKVVVVENDAAAGIRGWLVKVCTKAEATSGRVLDP